MAQEIHTLAQAVLNQVAATQPWPAPYVPAQGFMHQVPPAGVMFGPFVPLFNDFPR